MSTLTQAKREAIERYHERTYKRVILALRLDEDADIIKDLADAQEHGISYREWLRELYDNQKK